MRSDESKFVDLILFIGDFVCSHFHSVTDALAFKSSFGIALPLCKQHKNVLAGTKSFFIKKRSGSFSEDRDSPEKDVGLGFFGLTPQWSGTTSDQAAYNTPYETIHRNAVFAQAWNAGKRCIIPASAIFEPDSKSGRIKEACISRIDGTPLGIAGIWWSISLPDGKFVECFTMLTVDAEDYPLMQSLLMPFDAERMVVILDRDDYTNWLDGDVSEAAKFVRLYPATHLQIT